MTSEPRTNLWRHSAAEEVAAPPLSADAAADLLVIGGGFSGCSAALEAARLGASVCLLEAEIVGHGGSGRNVGLVNAGLWLPPDEIVATLGEAAARRLMDELGQGPETVFRLIERHGIACEATRNGTLHLAHAPSGLADLEQRQRQGNRIGAPVRLIDAEETRHRTGSDAFRGALLDPRAGTVQPLAYARGLAKAAAEAGARFCERTPVSRLERSGGRWIAEANGHRIEAGAVLLATNAYHQGLAGGPRPAHVAVHYSQFATVPMPEALRARILPGGEGCWDTALAMSSFRIDRAGRMILGGMGDAEGPGRVIHHGWARRKLREVYPELADLPFEHAWTGRIAMTSDHVPKVVEFGPSALAIFGYSGRGIAPGTVFGTAAARALLRGDAEALPLRPRPSHSESFAGLRGAYYEFGAVALHLAEPRPSFLPSPTTRGTRP